MLRVPSAVKALSLSHVAVLVVLILACGGFFIARELTPQPSRYEFLPAADGAAVYRADLKTGELQFFAMYEGRLRLWIRHAEPQTDDQFRALGINPTTGEVADFALFNRGRLTWSPPATKPDEQPQATTPSSSVVPATSDVLDEERWLELVGRHGAEWGLDPQTGRVVDEERFQAARAKFFPYLPDEKR